MTTLRELEQAASPAPWTSEAIGGEGYVVYSPALEPRRPRRRVAACTWLEWATDKANGALIANVRNALPAIADALEQMEREHAHHHIPGTVACHGCLLLGRVEQQLRGVP